MPATATAVFNPTTTCTLRQPSVGKVALQPPGISGCTLWQRRPADERQVTVRRQPQTLTMEFAMSDSIKQQFIRDMQLAGLAHSTQQRYLDIIVRFVRRTGTRPQDATEAQVAEYLLGLINKGQCQGTIAPIRGALRFVFENTLGRQWGLFKKRSPPSVASVCPRPTATPILAGSSPPLITRCAVFAWH